MRLPLITTLLLPPLALAVKTSIYIDQIPLYASLPACAEEKVSAVIRAQSSGCGDDMQLTSFSCFCIDSSSHFSSIISTAVGTNCRATGTTGTATTTAVAAISSAEEVFRSYCQRSTELAWYANNATTTTPPATAIITITAAPQTPSSTTTATAPSTPPQKKTHVAAIVAPVIVGTLVLVGACILFFYLRRRRALKRASQAQHASYAYEEKDGLAARGELVGDVRARGELSGEEAEPTYELESRERSERAELEGGGVEEQRR